jgi:hypothetical protein
MGIGNCFGNKRTNKQFDFSIEKSEYVERIRETWISGKT